MPKPKRVGERVYRQLHDDLVSCRIRPGERLLTEPLCARFGVSFTVVREALARLAAEGFAVADPSRGFTAAEISVPDILALTDARIGVEMLCLRESLLLGDAEWQATVAARRDAVLATPVADTAQPLRISQTFLEAHDAFHDALVAGCTNGWLHRVRSLLQSQSSRYRQICIPLEPSLPSRERGYREIAAAALGRDFTKASALITERFRRNTADFVQAIEATIGDPARFWCDIEDAETDRTAA
ncbi:MAG: hypothetical protein JWR77_1911 [Rhizorhabdus sp.]|nr:hypothetical protein [Rhizorhabdus sp.]